MDEPNFLTCFEQFFNKAASKTSINKHEKKKKKKKKFFSDFSSQGNFGKDEGR